ncbi:hypothetical protein SAMN05878503_1229 [Cereibacter ovatus]|uniref:Uncharacterized protein n=1 Tax=Cereibacter ovatus TaxID=439529 RepID=A0A285D5C4_9RHOB|nr:hypothetical protein SAMN05878503_1229 [Cereibacter ovatus]
MWINWLHKMHCKRTDAVTGWRTMKMFAGIPRIILLILQS